MNNLLIWMSARGEGSWQQFRSAVEEFHVDSDSTGEDDETSDDRTASDLPVYQAVRMGLERLAHVEFFTAGTETDWRVVPPALAAVEQNDQCIAFACGARSPDLCETLNLLNGDVSWDSEEIPGMPDRIRLCVPNIEALHRVAEQLSFFVQEQAPASLLTAIPAVDNPISHIPDKPPSAVGWTIERFSPSKPHWVKSEAGDVDDGGTNLFRYRFRYQRFHYLCWQGRMFKVQVQVGKYAVLKHRRIKKLLAYSSKQHTLSVPVIFRPPPLIERALVLCSGLLPRFDRSSGRLEYTHVPPAVARLAADRLRQEI